MRKIWPDMSGTQQAQFRREFEQARGIEVDIIDPHIAVAGNSATILFVRHYELLPVRGQPQRVDTTTTMTLRRADQGWVIESIRYAPR
jgi:hypothetical protein